MAGEEAEELAREVLDWIDDESAGPDYAWPGNYRELEQCVKNVLIRRNYRPVARGGATVPWSSSPRDARAGRLTADELLARYVTIVYQPHRQLRRDRPPVGPGPADREGKSSAGW